MPKNLVEGNIYELNFCNACMLVVEVDGEIFTDNPAGCGCPAYDVRLRLTVNRARQKGQKIGPGQCATKGVVSILELDCTCWEQRRST